MKITNNDKAEILLEALPYIRKYAGETVVIKYGGSAMTDETLKKSVVKDIILLQQIGVKTVLVHGGGPEISEALKRMGVGTKFVNGLRVTDAESMNVVQMVLAGKADVAFSSAAGRIEVCSGGSGIDFSEEKAKAVLSEKEITIEVDLGCGVFDAVAWGCDLTYDYVKINGDYRT